MASHRSTIVAIATPSGRGGVGMVRLSGPSSKAILSRLFTGELSSHRMRHGALMHRGRMLDDAMVVWMQAPHSYTGEDSVEIYAHGNPTILNDIVQATIDEGATLAGPGEFTRRAYLHGRIDLVQAEAVAELIHAESTAEIDAAKARLSGRLSSEISNLYDRLLSVLAECEADVDFPDENLPLADRPHLGEAIEALNAAMRTLLASYDTQKKLNDGFSIAFVGAPNAGKSSLFNALLSMDRAIVTPIAGTTRDVLREEMFVEGRKLRVLDTAGLRHETQDAIEQMGMERTKEVLTKADLVLWVVSVEEGMRDFEEEILSEVLASRCWVLWNKSDLGSKTREIRGLRSFLISAKTKAGLDDFRQALAKAVLEKTPAIESGGISNDRQRLRLIQAQEGLVQGWQAWQKGESSEFAAFEFRRSLRALAELLGRVDPVEDTLDRIFSTFCIGK